MRKLDWNPNLYDNKHNFVAEYGKELLEYIPNKKNQKILDLGCGTGSLTNELFNKSSNVIGIDGSLNMIEEAKSTYPNIEFYVMDACNIEWKNYFDVVFSNAVFHWIKDQRLLLSSIYNSLKSSGVLICEFGSYGNIYKIQSTFRNILKKFDYNYVDPFFFPKKDDYICILENQGFRIEFIESYDRPTVLNDGKYGLRNWVKQFFADVLESFSDSDQMSIFEEMEEKLKPELWNGKNWIADYKRLRIVAYKES